MNECKCIKCGSVFGGLDTAACAGCYKEICDMAKAVVDAYEGVDTDRGTLFEAVWQLSAALKKPD